jgi:hypothetical protein
MTQVCCPSCRLRFSHAVGAHLVACPSCGEPPQSHLTAAQAIGFRLATDEELFAALPDAAVGSMPLPEPPGGPARR